MKLLAAAVACLAACPFAGAAEPSPRDLHAAECVAALDLSAQTLAEQVKSGREDARALLMERIVSGTAFVGDTYLHGSADEQQARALANQAQELQKRLPPAALEARQRACAMEGAKLYEDNNGLERAVVKRLAKKRMDKLLGG